MEIPGTELLRKGELSREFRFIAICARKPRPGSLEIARTQIAPVHGSIRSRDMYLR